MSIPVPPSLRLSPAINRPLPRSIPLIYYAIKANSRLSLLRHFARLGAGFDIVSGGRLERVLAIGGDPENRVSGMGKTGS